MMAFKGENTESLVIVIAIFLLIISVGVINSSSIEKSKKEVVQKEKVLKKEQSLNKDFSEGRKVVEGLNNVNVNPEKRQLSKTIEQNGKASGLNGLSLE